MFVDSSDIFIKAGNGGDGRISFRREKYVPDGGPDGGDGGKGGSIIFEIDEGINTLNDYRYKRKRLAENGEDGGARNCFGKDGKDLVLKVPEGTIVKDKESGKIIADLSHNNSRVEVLKGGRGGKGNQHFATSTNQAPKFAKPGIMGQGLDVTLELKVIADVGLVGFPNVGKSTLLSRVSNARPKIANYHFTTLSPNLGVVDLADTDGFVIADIPGLIEGASDGIGLGHEFLKHIERTRMIIHVVDAASTEGRDPIEDIRIINRELNAYNSDLGKLPQVIAANKVDVLFGDSEDEIISKLREEFADEGYKVFSISAVSGQGINELLYYVKQQLDTMEVEPIVFEVEYDPKDNVIEDDTFTVEKEADGLFVVEGPKIERMLNNTNLQSEKGFSFFQRFMKDNEILKELEELGIIDGDTVRLYGWEFEYYK